MNWINHKGLLVFKADYRSEAKHRSELSLQLIASYGKDGLSSDVQRKAALSDGLDFFADKFKSICLNEVSVRFYQTVFLLHEDSIQIALDIKNLLPNGVSSSYFVVYRRVLKFILETGCEVEMKTTEEFGPKHYDRISPILSELLFLGEMMLMCAAHYSEEDMVAGMFELVFDENELYTFRRNERDETAMSYVMSVFGPQTFKPAVDDDGLGGFNEFTDAINDCFGIEYKVLGHLIASIHEQNKEAGGEIVGVDWRTLSNNLHRFTGIEESATDQFLRGLMLNSENKMDLEELVCKPYKLNRYLYRPIIGWNIDGGQYFLVGKNSWTEAIVTQLVVNAIPWGNAPKEWLENRCFKDFVHQKEDEHAGWLEDELEKVFEQLSTPYDRNVKRVNGSNGPVTIDVEGLGEIDFIVLSETEKKIYLIDCKNLLGRFDTINQRNDFNVFVKGSGSMMSYNLKMEKKCDWFAEKQTLVAEHFSSLDESWSFDLSDYQVQGAFVINSPTFYMFMADPFRVYTVEDFSNVLNGSYSDAVLTLEHTGEQIEHPYFKMRKLTE